MSLWDYKNVEEFKEKAGYVIDGVWFPRVTKILEIKAKPALYFFYGQAASYRDARAITEKSAEEGTMMHEAVEGILTGKNDPIPEEVRPGVEAFREFMDEKNIQVAPEHVERRIVNHDHRYAGTIDTLALIDGRFGVLDIKTSQAIYRDYNLQTSAYMDAMKYEFPNLQTRWILRIDQIKSCLRCGASMRPKGGREKVRPGPVRGISLCPAAEHYWSELKGVVELKESPYWEQDFQAFLGAKKLWEWENESWLEKTGYL